MNGRRRTAVLVLVLLNALDGFDIISVSFAASGIARDLNLQADMLGLVLAMELVGMALGSILLGGIADTYGRRKAIAGCLVLTALGMLAVPWTGTVAMLCVARVVTGIGIGGMLAGLSAMVAELGNDRWRNMLMSLIFVGYPVGAIAGGIASRFILDGGDWRDIFLVGAIATASFIPIFLMFVPESPAFLAVRGGVNALDKINQIFRRFGLPPASSISFPEPSRAPSLLAIFSRELRPIVIIMTIAYIAQVTCYYFFIKWVPKILFDLGFSAQSSADVLVAVMAGCGVGSVAFGLSTKIVPVSRMTIFLLIGSAAMVWLFGVVEPSYGVMLAIGALCGVFLSGAMVGFYVILARDVPTALRASGIGFVTGVGRAASAIGPAMGGWLLGSGASVATTMMCMAAGPLVSAAAILVYLVVVEKRRPNLHI